MIRSFAMRVLSGVVLLLAVIVLNFLLIQLAPGDAVDVLIADGGASEEVIQRIREAYGLDQSVLTQLMRYIAAIFQGDLRRCRSPSCWVLRRSLSRRFLALFLGWLLHCAQTT